jgi:hypothetical protein
MHVHDQGAEGGHAALQLRLLARRMSAPRAQLEHRDVQARSGTGRVNFAIILVGPGW